MLVVPALPLESSAKEILDFCLTFRTVAGFIEVFEQYWQDEFNSVEQFKGVAYEKTEILHNHLFGRRKYKDREVFYSARSRYYA